MPQLIKAQHSCCILVGCILRINVKGSVSDFCKQTDFAGQCAFSINETNDQWRTVITQLRCSRQIEIDAVIGSSVSNLSWMNFNTMLLVLTKTNNLIQVK